MSRTRDRQIVSLSDLTYLTHLPYLTQLRYFMKMTSFCCSL